MVFCGCISAVVFSSETSHQAISVHVCRRVAQATVCKHIRTRYRITKTLIDETRGGQYVYIAFYFKKSHFQKVKRDASLVMPRYAFIALAALINGNFIICS